MNNKFLSLITLIMCSLAVMAQETVPQVSTGRLEFYPEFQSKHITPRNVTVWLPEGYQVGEPCDVLYMHDGQMLFDATTTWNHQEWQVDEVMGRLIAEGKVRRCIVVGVDNTRNRLNDYFPSRCYENVPEGEREGVDVSQYKGDEYLRFLVEEVKPFIDNRYKPLTTREHTFVMGSSMGGLISLYALCNYPEVFGGAACMSTHLSMNFFDPKFKSELWAEGLRDYVKEHLPSANSALLYMDGGTVELDDTYRPYQNKLNAVISGLGWDSAHFVYYLFEGHKHMETYWAERLDQPFVFLLKK
ncbi:MAG: esterase family protein [Muribaculaceae bacterium]|nr:esterase family protein [Muribaculaceae bacterium]